MIVFLRDTGRQCVEVQLSMAKWLAPAQFSCLHFVWHSAGLQSVQCTVIGQE